MSAIVAAPAAPPLYRVEKAPDARLAPKETPTIRVPVGAQQASIVRAPATCSASQITANVLPTAAGGVLERAIRADVSMYLSFTFKVPGCSLLQPIAVWGRDIGLCDSPLMKLTSAATVQCNSASLQRNVSATEVALQRVRDLAKDRAARGGPSYLPRFQSINDEYGTSSFSLGGMDTIRYDGFVGNGTLPMVTLTDRTGTPLSGSGTYVDDGGQTVQYATNAADGSLTLVANATTVAGTNSQMGYALVSWSEYLPIEPFADGPDSAAALFGVSGLTQIAITLQLHSVLNARLLRSCSAAANFQLSSQALANVAQPISAWFVMNQMTPPHNLLPPPRYTLPYLEANSVVTTYSTAVPSNTSVTLTSNAVQVPKQPMAFIVYAVPNAYLATDNNWMLPISAANITMGGASGVLNSMVPYDLYCMSRNCGMSKDISYAEFLGYAMMNGRRVPTIGAPLVIDSRYLPLPEEVIAGTNVGSTFQITVSVTNQSSATLASGFSLYVIPMFQNFLTIERATGTTVVSGMALTEEAASNAPIARPALTNKPLLGGGFLDSLKHTMGGLSDIANAAHAVGKFVEGGKRGGAVPGVRAAGRLASLEDRLL